MAQTLLNPEEPPMAQALLNPYMRTFQNPLLSSSALRCSSSLTSSAILGFCTEPSASRVDEACAARPGWGLLNKSKDGTVFEKKPALEITL